MVDAWDYLKDPTNRLRGRESAFIAHALTKVIPESLDLLSGTPPSGYASQAELDVVAATVAAEAVTRAQAVADEAAARLAAGLEVLEVAELPAAGTAGRIRIVTDDLAGPWIDTGTRWVPLGDGVSPKWFGEFADANSHPLSSRYASLAAAQVDYPFAAALTQECDWAAIQKAVLAVSLMAGVYANPVKKVVLSGGAVYVIRDTVTISDHRTFIQGAGEAATGIIFNPATAQPCFKFSASGGTVDFLQGGISDIGFVGEPTTVPKTAILLESTTGFRLENIYIANWSSATRSIVASITATETTLHVPAATMVVGDVGKTVQIPGAAADGGLLVTTIASFTNASTVELTAAASVTVASVSGVVLPVGFAPSVGVQCRGHDLLVARKITVHADRPIWIQGDKKGSGYDCDHFHFSDTYLVATVPAEDCIAVDALDLAGGAPLNITDLVIDGTNAWARGRHGFYWPGGAVATGSQALSFSSIRREQSEDPTGYTIYVANDAGNVLCTKVTADPQANGFYFRYCDSVLLISPQWLGDPGGIAVNADDTCNHVQWIGANWSQPSDFALTALREIFADDDVPTQAHYAASSITTMRGGAKSATMRMAALVNTNPAFQRTVKPISGTLAVVSAILIVTVTNASGTYVQGGLFMVNTVGITMLYGTAGIVGSHVDTPVADKVNVQWSATTSVQLQILNLSAETVDVLIDMKWTT